MGYTKYIGNDVCGGNLMSNSRLMREKKTMENMVAIFCRHNHKENEELCTSCRELLEYAVMRLNKCSFGPKKPVCLKCTVHCYKQDMREQIRQVMRFSGKRMAFAHPVLTIRHLLDLIE
jgi:hypothetical protein